MVQFDLKKLFGVPSAQQRLAGLRLRPDLARAVQTVVVSDERFDREIQKLETYLTAAESVVIVVEGIQQHELGLLVLTTERVLFRLHGATEVTELPLTQISGVQDRARGMTGRVRIQAVDSIFEVDKILGVQAAQFAQALRRQLADPDSVPETDPVKELLELREQRAAGIIQESDFQAAKKRLLDEL